MMTKIGPQNRTTLPQSGCQDEMLISEDYKQLAERCMRLASECSDPTALKR
jgi:hypothetical protein